MGKRKEAMQRGENTYFTGKRCSNGHLTYRYVQSGSCSACINANAAKYRPEPVLQYVLPLVTFKCRIFPVDVQMVLDAAVGMTQRRHPGVMRHQVVRNEKGRYPAAGVNLFELNVDAEDVDLLRQMVNALMSARCGPAIENPALAALRDKPRDPTWNERFGK